MPNIPSVDLNNFLSDDQSLKQEFVNKLGKAYQDIGFVALKGHFLKDTDIWLMTFSLFNKVSDKSDVLVSIEKIIKFFL